MEKNGGGDDSSSANAKRRQQIWIQISPHFIGRSMGSDEKAHRHSRYQGACRDKRPTTAGPISKSPPPVVVAEIVQPGSHRRRFSRSSSHPPAPALASHQHQF
ncbi:unnamed protein product [Linum trigynum]|uniref:Uncharacterized protein n=1 Tax=Linum trigynum TaxID=586398 RepID=A0AAV2E9V2_9ROSI